MLERLEAFVHEAGVQPLPLSALSRGTVRARWMVSFLLLLAITTAFFDRINVAVLFTNKEFQSDLGVSDPALMGLLMTAFVFPYGASAFLFSFCGDFFGPRRTLSAIAAILGSIMAFMGTLSSYPLMLGARMLIGVTEGPQFGAANGAVKRWFPPHEQGLANAFWTIGSPLGSALGFPLVLFLVTQFGWRASFYVLGALNAFIVLPVIWFFLKDKPPAELAPEAQPSPKDSVPFREALRLLARDWRFWLLPVYNSGTLIYLWGLNSWLPTYLQEARHFDLAHTGFYSALPFVLMVIGQLGGAWIADRTGRRAAVCFASQFMAGVFVYFAAVAPGATLAAWCIALSAGFWGGTTPPLFAIGMQIIPRSITSLGFGLYAGFANLVGSTAPFIMGVLIGSTGNYSAGLYFLVFCCIGLSTAMLPLVRTH